MNVKPRLHKTIRVCPTLRDGDDYGEVWVWDVNQQRWLNRLVGGLWIDWPYEYQYWIGKRQRVQGSSTYVSVKFDTSLSPSSLMQKEALADQLPMPVHVDENFWVIKCKDGSLSIHSKVNTRCEVNVKSNQAGGIVLRTGNTTTIIKGES